MDDFKNNRDSQEQPQAPVRHRRKKKPLIVQIIHRASPRMLAIGAGALLILIVLIVLLCKGCNSAPDTQIEATAFGSGTVLGLPLEAELNPGDYVSYGGYQFESGKKLSAMSKLITKNNEGVTAETYQNAYGSCAVFTREGEGGAESWCLYQKDPANTKNWYIFMGMHREINLESGKLDVLLPLHLISDSYLRDNMGAHLELGTTYACGLDKLDAEQTVGALFRSFYEESGLYTISASADGFTIVPRGGTEELIFTFSETDGIGKFAINTPVIEEPEPSSTASASYDGGEEHELPEQDALTLSSALISAEYIDGEPANEPLYTADVDGTLYEIDAVWQDDTWSVTASTDGKTAELNALNSCTVMAVLAANDVGPTSLGGYEDVWPEDITLTPTASCMVTSTSVNVRSAPFSKGEFTGSVLLTMEEGTPVAITAQVSNGWYRINFNGSAAFMHGDYLKLAASPAN